MYGLRTLSDLAQLQYHPFFSDVASPKRHLYLPLRELYLMHVRGTREPRKKKSDLLRGANDLRPPL